MGTVNFMGIYKSRQRFHLILLLEHTHTHIYTPVLYLTVDATIGRGMFLATALFFFLGKHVHNLQFTLNYALVQ